MFTERTLFGFASVRKDLLRFPASGGMASGFRGISLFHWRFWRFVMKVIERKHGTFDFSTEKKVS